MVYATAKEMEDLLGERMFLEAADRDHDGSADLVAVESALRKASSLADSYLARWLPVEEPPEALKDAVIRIAHYQLTGETGNEETRRRYDDAIQWLRDIASGKASLGIPPRETPAWAGDAEMFVAGGACSASRRALRGIL